MNYDPGKLPLLGRTALISGSSSGIGAGVALAFARAGASWVIVNYPADADAAAAKAVADEVRGLGARAIAERADVADEGEAARGDCLRVLDRRRGGRLGRSLALFRRKSRDHRAGEGRRL